MLTLQQESNLTSAGDCFEHWHSQDRVPVYSDIAEYQSLARQVVVSSDAFVSPEADYLLVDTSMGDVNIQLPPAMRGREIEVIKTASAYRVIILPDSGETIIGAEGVVIQSRYDALRIKAVQNMGWVAI